MNSASPGHSAHLPIPACQNLAEHTSDDRHDLLEETCSSTLIPTCYRALAIDCHLPSLSLLCSSLFPYPFLTILQPHWPLHPSPELASTPASGVSFLHVLPPGASLLLHASPECHLIYIGEAIPDTALNATPFPAFCPFFVLYNAVYHLTHKIFLFFISPLLTPTPYCIVSPTKSGPCPSAFLL